MTALRAASARKAEAIDVIPGLEPRLNELVKLVYFDMRCTVSVAYARLRAANDLLSGLALDAAVCFGAQSRPRRRRRPASKEKRRA